MPENTTSQYITITVAEYVCLTKAATMLEVIVNDKSFSHHATVEAVKATVRDMQRMAEAGAEK